MKFEPLDGCTSSFFYTLLIASHGTKSVIVGLFITHTPFVGSVDHLLSGSIPISWLTNVVNEFIIAVSEPCVLLRNACSLLSSSFLEPFLQVMFSLVLSLILADSPDVSDFASFVTIPQFRVICFTFLYCKLLYTSVLKLTQRGLPDSQCRHRMVIINARVLPNVLNSDVVLSC